MSSAPGMAPRSFLWNGVAYPIPQGWLGLSMKAWFRRQHEIRHGLARIERDVSMKDRPNAIASFLRGRAGFQDQHHFEAFVAWGSQFWEDQR